MGDIRELFIVEGASAESTLGQFVEKSSQSVLAIQGKLLNVDNASEAKVLSNEMCQKVFDSLSCGVKDECRPDQLKYSKIFLLTDPDIDGVHSRILLLKLFARYLRPIIDAGHLHVIIPPLFRLSSMEWKQNKYAWTQAECDNALHEFADDAVEIMQYKGIAQFSAEECMDLLKPETRKQFRIRSDEE